MRKILFLILFFWNKAILTKSRMDKKSKEMQKMDINCTHRCFHQYDGKCTLNELQGFTQTAVTATHDIDCPYYTDGSSAASSGYPNSIA